ncbi:probable G-protein coupled receptor 139 [Leucoraja erinacea]|uniref:probable G-protein coupled receptor 139 n=1 Tax=Leucoraja erinaceus TaxID=7782 RepID=UPI002453A637|nr:probable G-protein coupled receptor 139 [Leucoraja erinacea]
MSQLEIILGIKYIYYPLLTAVGVAVNVAAIVVLSRGKCALSKCITRYLVAMAAADLLVIIVDVLLNKILASHFPLSFLHNPIVCSLRRTLLRSATDNSVWSTVLFTFDRFVAICCPVLKVHYCTEKTATLVLWTVGVLGCLNNIPWYFTFESEYTIDGASWGCQTKSSFYTSPAWSAFAWFDVILTPCVPFFLILLLNAITVRHILIASRVRKGLRGGGAGADENDPEMESRRKSIILLLSISGTFILLWMLHVLLFLYSRITNDHESTGNEDPLFIAQQTGAMLLLLSCCTNTFIYVATQAKFREELKNGTQYLFKICLPVTVLRL